MGAVRSRWAAIGAAVAVCLGAGGVSLSQAALDSGARPVLVSITPCRLVDTRPAAAIGARTTPLGPGETLTLRVTGSTGECEDIPNDAVAAAMNVTAIAGSERSFLTLYPANASLPNASNLNWNGGDPPTPNKVDVKLSPSGEVKVTNAFGTVHIAADLVGYYVDHNHDDRYYRKAQVDSMIAGVVAGEPTGYARVLVVAESGGDFTSVSAAMNAIGGPDYPAPSSSSRYLVWVAPGVYEDQRVVMQPWVDLAGSGRNATIITDVGGGGGIAPGAATLVGAANAEVRDITIENVSATAGNWAFAVYTTENTLFSNVTAIASGGSNPRGMVVHDGAMPVLRNVSLLSSGGSSGTVGLDVFQASLVADGVFASASTNAGNAQGYFVNASTDVRIENASAIVDGGTATTSGFWVQNSDAIVSGLDARVSGRGATLGLACSNAVGTVEVSAVDLNVEHPSGSGSTRGAYASNCDLELRNGTIDVESNVAVIGVETTHSRSQTKLEAADLDIAATSGGGTAQGIQMSSSGPSNRTVGSIRNVAIDVVGAANAQTRGIWAATAGSVGVDDVAISTGGDANYLYGVHVTAGSHDLSDVDVRVDGSTLTTIGIEVTGTASDVRVDRGTVVATNQIAGGDAVGIKSTTAGTRFSDLTVDAYAGGVDGNTSGIWGVDVTAGSTALSGVDATATALAGYNTARGVRCLSSTLDIADSRLDAKIETGAPFLTRYGVESSDCILEIDGSDVRTSGSGGSSAALRASATSDLPGPAEVIVRGSRLLSTGYGLYLSGSADVAVFDSDMGSVVYADAATATCQGVSQSTTGGAAFGFITNGAC